MQWCRNTFCSYFIYYNSVQCENEVTKCRETILTKFKLPNI